jgi:hypothetical protein
VFEWFAVSPVIPETLIASYLAVGIFHGFSTYAYLLVDGEGAPA